MQKKPPMSFGAVAARYRDINECANIGYEKIAYFVQPIPLKTCA